MDVVFGRRNDGTVNAGVFIDFCKRLLADASGPVYPIVDGHPAHRAKATTTFVASTDDRLRLIFLPGYSPEPNPDEWVWKNVKYDRIGKTGVISKHDLKSKALSGRCAGCRNCLHLSARSSLTRTCATSRHEQATYFRSPW